MTVKHTYQSATGNNAASEVSSTRWNAAHVIDVLDLTAQTSDPGSPADGNLWYNSTEGYFKARSAGATFLIGGQKDVPFLTPVANDYVLTTTGAGGQATGTLAGAANRLEIFPFIARDEIVVTGVAVNCTTLVAASLCKVVIYDSDALGRPNARLYESADMDTSTTGVKTAAATITLKAGRTYWIGIRHNSTATLSVWAGAATADINGGSPVTTARKTLRRTLTYATASTTPWGFVVSEINAGPATAIWLKV